VAEPLTGRCLCGAIRYQCGPPLYPPTLCHCESCRRAAGAHAVGWITVAAASLSFGATAPREYASSPEVRRSFCPACGTPLSYRHARRAGEIDVTLCSLDLPAPFAPVDHIWMRDALPWDRPADGLPQYGATRRLP
jgi:hypothetical protein